MVHVKCRHGQCMQGTALGHPWEPHPCMPAISGMAPPQQSPAARPAGCKLIQAAATSRLHRGLCWPLSTGMLSNSAHVRVACWRPFVRARLLGKTPRMQPVKPEPLAQPSSSAAHYAVKAESETQSDSYVIEGLLASPGVGVGHGACAHGRRACGGGLAGPGLLHAPSPSPPLSRPRRQAFPEGLWPSRRDVQGAGVHPVQAHVPAVQSRGRDL